LSNVDLPEPEGPIIAISIGLLIYKIFPSGRV